MDNTPYHNEPAEAAESPAPATKIIPETNTPDSKPCPKNNQAERDNALDRAMVRWTRVVGIFTVILAVVGGIQAGAFIQSERAAVYVNIEKFVPTPPVPDKPISSAIRVINNGNSQAFLTEGKAQLSFYYRDIPDTPSFLDAPYSMTGVVPAHGFRFWQIGPTNVLNWAQVGEINNGNTKVVIFGYVSYIDDFTILGPKRLGFCGIYDSKQAESVTPTPPIDECNKAAYVYYK